LFWGTRRGGQLLRNNFAEEGTCNLDYEGWWDFSMGRKGIPDRGKSMSKHKVGDNFRKQKGCHSYHRSDW
jgi:hypothetical protein